MKHIFRIIPALIMLQTLFFKFTGSAESIYIFDTLGLGDLGRYGSGVAELIAAILLLMPKWTKLGSILTVGIMSGAILSHLGPLGIDVMGDQGLLFYLALATLMCAVINFFLSKDELRLGSIRL